MSETFLIMANALAKAANKASSTHGFYQVCRLDIQLNLKTGETNARCWIGFEGCSEIMAFDISEDAEVKRVKL